MECRAKPPASRRTWAWKREAVGSFTRITFADARRGSRELDMTDAEAEKLGGRQVARRGRKPKTNGTSG